MVPAVLKETGVERTRVCRLDRWWVLEPQATVLFFRDEALLQFETWRARGKARVAATGRRARFVDAACSAMRDPEALSASVNACYLGPAVRKGTKGEVESHKEGPWQNWN